MSETIAAITDIYVDSPTENRGFRIWRILRGLRQQFLKLEEMQSVMIIDRELSSLAVEFHRHWHINLFEEGDDAA